MSFSYGTSLLLKFLHNNFFSDYETRCSIKLNTPCLHSRPLSKQCNVNFLFIGIRKFGELGAHPRIMARFAQKAQAFLERKLRLLSERYSSSDCPHYLHICNLSFPLTELVMWVDHVFKMADTTYVALWKSARRTQEGILVSCHLICCALKQAIEVFRPLSLFLDHSAVKLDMLLHFPQLFCLKPKRPYLSVSESQTNKNVNISV